ncbi:C2 domain [Trinorchestia longiramus]|nr:C2 domain [Trinorchestia longiramus]
MTCSVQCELGLVYDQPLMTCSVQCELGLVYDQPLHALVNRWLVLTHPEEDTPTVQGYLKVSVAVLGPGQTCPDLPVSKSDADDVEANLLWAAGVHLQPAAFALDVFCAHDLPRMDSGTMQTLKEVLGIGKASKELVDPYLVGSYAGREVQTKVLYCNDNPEFRQTIRLGFLFPSMCNTLRLALMDWDRVGHDDIIGTAIIPVNAISAAGEDGFLPTFGPSYVNFYGAQREWELWHSSQNEARNEGVEEGVAFRGRVLVSLHTQVGAYPSSPLTNITVEDFEKVRRHRATRQFTVLAHLTHVSLLTEASKPLQVEVSIGHFGNKLENSLLPSPSTTHPANPVFDGCKYYYLAWGDAAPLVSVQCDWEDISHRLHAANALSNAASALKRDLDSLKTQMRGKKTRDHKLLEVLVKECLERAITLCSTPLPLPDPIRHSDTSLDGHLRHRRQRHLAKLVANCQMVLRKLETRGVTQAGETIIQDVAATTTLKAEEVLQEAVQELQDTRDALLRLAEEPQSSIPDVFVWLISGTKRLAYVRVPARDLLHASDPACAGRRSGVFWCYPVICPGTGEMAGLVRMSLWLGRADEVRQWWSARPDLQLTVYAETYENQVTSIGSGKWTNKGPLMNRPTFSDADGLVTLKKDAISCPEGWQFQGDWFIAPDPSIKYNLDAGHAVYSEEVFEQQMRVPGGTWVDAPTHWADVQGEPSSPRDEIQCPSGWAWRDFWTTDVQRAVDSEGWEYTVQKGIVGWSPQQKVYHVLRRRRWYRERHRQGKIEKSTEGPIEGWEYSSLFGRRFHARERRVDVVRRRRWRRKMVPGEEAILSDVPRMIVKTESEDAPQFVSCPRQYVVSAERQLYQLRAHIYQARDLPAGDKSGLSDPFAVVSFCELSQQTEHVRTTLCPTWDQTLIFDNLLISGPLVVPPMQGEVQKPPARPPSVVVNIFDWDARGKPEFLGRAVCEPTVQDPQAGYLPTPLRWHPLRSCPGDTGNGVGSGGGELLASFELLVGGLEDAPPTRGNVYMVPFEVRPRLQKTRIEVLCWGVRNMTTFELQSVTRPSVEFECGGQRVRSSVMDNLRNNPNFDQPHLVFDVELPREELYMPPLTLRVQDHRSFGSRPVVATAVVSDLSTYTVEPALLKRYEKQSDAFELEREKLTAMTSAPMRMDSAARKVTSSEGVGAPVLALTHRQRGIEPGTVDTDVDWWAKFYASSLDPQRSGAYLSKGYEKLEVLGFELEEDPRYSGFTDLISSVPLMRGKGDAAAQVGEFKGTFRVYQLPTAGSAPDPPKFLSSFPSPAPHEITARVYVVLAKDLAPKDSGGSSDPYVVVSLGKQTRSNVKEYRPNTLCPIFGEVFEVSGTLPVNKDLVVQVWDKDLVSSDDLIGETTIDLENRYLSRHRSTVGLPKQYHVSGSNRWRDPELPTAILSECARLRHFDLTWQNSPLSVTVGDTKYSLSDFEPDGAVLPQSLGSERECLALHVLHVAFPLVAEHVETRDLHHPARPGLSQGKLMLWVDLFPSGTPIPPPVDITPRKPRKFEVRLVVYNVHGAPLQESNIAGEKMSDVYVKGWLQGTDHVLKTDIHYRCMDGEANFNWRLVFPLQYLEAEQSMVVTRKTHFWSVDDTEERCPPQLTLQLWDNDLILHDDYLSEMTLDLCRLPKPFRTESSVRLASSKPPPSPSLTTTSDGLTTSILLGPVDEETPLVNLFQVKRVFGFFPFTKVVDGKHQIAGCLEAELEVVSEEEAKERPAGLGRAPPNMNPELAEPDRPSTSFFWLTSPWKSFKFVLWRNYKWAIITYIIIFLLLLFAFLFLYSLPGASVDYILS